MAYIAVFIYVGNVVASLGDLFIFSLGEPPRLVDDICLTFPLLLPFLLSCDVILQR